MKAAEKKRKNVPDISSGRAKIFVRNVRMKKRKVLRRRTPGKKAEGA